MGFPHEEALSQLSSACRPTVTFVRTAHICHDNVNVTVELWVELAVFGSKVVEGI